MSSNPQASIRHELEGSLEIFFKIEILTHLKGFIENGEVLDPIHGKGPNLAPDMAKPNQVEAPIHCENLERIHFPVGSPCRSDRLRLDKFNGRLCPYRLCHCGIIPFRPLGC